MNHLDNAPMCTGHKLPAILLTSKTEGSAGRQFYKCPQPRGSQCNFFAWVDELPSSQPKDVNIFSSTTTPARPSQSQPNPPSTPTPASSLKRTFSATEHGDVGISPASLKRTRLMEAALSQPSSSQEGELQPEPSTSSQRPRFKPAAQNAISDISTLSGSQNEGGGSGTLAPKTPTRLQYSSTLAPSPSLPGTPVRQQINSRLASTMGSEIGSPGTLPDGNLKELTADSIADMLQQLSRVPEYIRKLESSEKKRRAADKSREAKDSKIKNLEDEVKGLKAREKELEAVIAEYERQDSD